MLGVWFAVELPEDFTLERTKGFDEDVFLVFFKGGFVSLALGDGVSGSVAHVLLDHVLDVVRVNTHLAGITVGQSELVKEFRGLGL